ncbi:MAG: hypothetical protein K2Q01_04270, partial [Rickettsiales bacterium]|nr:hypothetical protein [Rickettsiales bacterium]
AVKPSLRAEVVAKVKAKTLQLASFVDDGYGEVIVSGDTAMPPREVIKQVAEIFQVPIRDLFKDIDMDAVIAKEVERLKKELGIA